MTRRCFACGVGHEQGEVVRRCDSCAFDYCNDHAATVGGVTKCHDCKRIDEKEAAMSEPMDKRDVWTGRYRGIAYEVSCYYREWSGFEARTDEPKRPCWAHYIYVPEGMIPAEKRPAFFVALADDSMRATGFRYYDYYKSALADLEWHGGITYYKIHHAEQPGNRIIQAGCDYQHSFDDGIHYSPEIVQREAKATIDSLHDRHPDLLVSDWYDGTWHPKSECEETPQGWLSPSGKSKMAKWDAENAARAAKESPHA